MNLCLIMVLLLVLAAPVTAQTVHEQHRLLREQQAREYDQGWPDDALDRRQWLRRQDLYQRQRQALEHLPSGDVPRDQRLVRERRGLRLDQLRLRRVEEQPVPQVPDFGPEYFRRPR
ncbi:MAG: hypothetical protein R3202_01695 [Candidatus Competibacterales bacterium]|nr:hypothetical protein [Candidatus Competibacterales bacterium]